MAESGFAPLMPKARLILLALASLAVAIGSAGAAPPAKAPGAAARAFAVKVVVPGSDGGATPVLAAPPHDQVSFLDGFQYPSDGSVLSVGAIAVGAGTTSGATARSTASSDVSAVSLFKGELTADALSARATGFAGSNSAAGDFAGSTLTNLVVLGQPVTPAPNFRVALGDWGYALTLAQATDPTAPKGAKGHKGTITALIVHLNTDHGGLPAGSEIQLGYAEAAAQTAPPTPEPKPSTGPPAGFTPGRHDETNGALEAARAGRRQVPRFGSPLTVHPRLTAGGYVFPVYGASSYTDTFGAARGDITSGWHHGDDIFGQVGQPLLAVADGTVFSIGWNEIGGNRLWLRDGQGNQFYYAHLSAFSTAAGEGAHVRAGTVVGFMGNTGDAITTPPHLHFEVHPVSFLFVGYDGAANPTPYLDAWKRLEDLKFPIASGWTPLVPGGARAPQAGAILLGVSDISTADGLDPRSLERAFEARVGPAAAP
jgi:murein DD-endopeptidase MepM/ murein hydrolase activator NlpD